MSKLISGRISGVDASFGESRNVSGIRHLSDYWGSKHARVFTDTVRSCKCLFELVSASFWELTATPLATPLAKWTSGFLFT
jgi:hypothetical protein